MAETDVIVETTETDEAAETETAVQSAPAEDNPEVARLKAEIARQKAALDKATKESAEFKRQLRASKSAEEQRAEEEKERQEAFQRELEDLRRESAVSKMSKALMGFIDDEQAATAIAANLYQGGDIESAIDDIKKAWGVKEKKLRMEFGKIPAPDAGDGAPQISAEKFAEMSYTERLELKRKFPETYKKLTTI